MAYPAHWTRIHSDLGTASAATFDSSRRIVGYLNITPRQGRETLVNWPRFRVAHNAHEGDHAARILAVTRNVRVRGGRGLCVEDSYTTKTQARYIELACLLVGRRSTNVVVGAGAPSAWSSLGPLIARSVSATKLP